MQISKPDSKPTTGSSSVTIPSDISGITQTSQAFLPSPLTIAKSTSPEYLKLAKELDKEHKCGKVCVKHISSVVRDKYINILSNVVHVCDVCFTVFRLKESVIKHLNACNHISSSEYLLEETRPVSGSNQASTSERTLKYIRNRCSTKCAVEPYDIGVFCPKPECNFFFSDSILACALHYQYLHNQNEQIYSVGHLKKEMDFEISKSHVCPDTTCKTKFKKLTDLIVHLNLTKHFPEPNAKEINVFVCSFDDCRFRSVNFHTFKTHMMKQLK